MTAYKSKHRFYIPPENVTSETILVKSPEYHHLVDVLRYKEGDAVSLFDGTGNEYGGTITAIDRTAKIVRVAVTAIARQQPPPRSLILVASLIKSAAMDLIIQKAAEVGVTQISPVVTERSVVRLDAKRQQGKIAKWQRTIKEAAKQCDQAVLPVLNSIGEFKEVLSSLDEVAAKYICTPYKLPQTAALTGTPQSVAVLIGPEGGFADTEIDFALSHGWQPLWLGETILRAETAAIASLSVICYQLGFWK